MKTKIVYILVSNEKDYYLEQALLSVYSLKVHNPDAVVSLVVDDNTAVSLEGSRITIKEYVSDVIVVPISSNLNNMERSRYLKTNLRGIVSGDYLFVDCDTLICEPLGDIDSFNCDIGMVADLNAPLPISEQSVIDKCSKGGFMNVKGEPYFNSGIIYCKDTEVSHRLYDEWYRMWLSSKGKGVPFDQPALCQANINLCHPITEISGIWNCQYKFSVEHLPKAKILHYYFNGGDKYHLFQSFVLGMIKRSGKVDSAITELIMHPKDRFYAVFSITETEALNYFNADMFYLYYNMPNMYNFCMKLNRIFEKCIFTLKRIH